MAMSLKSPATKFIGLGSSPVRIQPGKVPIREPEDRAGSAKLGERKRRQLVSILEKEKNKEKRERVAYVLIQKLIFKFGSKYTNMITFFVEEYFNSHDEINSQEIAALENEIRTAVKSSMDSLRSAKEKKEHELQAANEARNHAQDEANQPQSELVRPLSGKEWQLIQVYQSIQDEDIIRREKELEYRKKMNFRAALDQQRMQSKNQNSAELEDERKYVEHIYKDIEKFHSDEQTKRNIIKKKYRDELLGRKEHIEMAQKRLADEREEMRKIEIRNLQLAEQAVKEEAEAAIRKRQQQKENMDRIRKENEDSKRIRAIEKEKEAEEDFRLMQEYAAKLDRESKERDESFANRMKTMEIHGMKFATEGAGKIQREEQLRFEQQLLREQQRKAEDDRRKELLKEDTRRRNMQAQLEENRRQLEQRRVAEENEKKLDSELADHFRSESEAFQRDQEAKLRDYRRRQAEYRNKLDVQSQDWKKRSSNLDNITLTEKKINHEILEDLATPVMMSKVLHRVRMDTARAKTAK